MQERIIRSILAGNDAAVVMPTGGGKSLCYQLPAVVSKGTAIVISPLIALMQDQVAQLKAMGIPAAVLNSAVPWSEQSAIIREAAAGAYRLLYLSPERLAKQETVAWLSRVPIRFFAIDEAHCISEWGHEFRPEYRQLSGLRANFPGKPIAAFTASATQRVRHDILAQLQLENPHKYICSFHRPNLRFFVRECEDEKSQGRLLEAALRTHAGDNVIVYAPTIVRVESTVDFLAEKGIRAVPYHAKMDAGARRRNQERWMSDEVRVLVGTLAFGLGINKAAVRAVIHLSLPKSLEQYYQEAGRAGRDGLESDCALLWRKKDAGLLAHFIEAIVDRAEQQRAWDRYRVIRGFAESATCRHRQICLHFGETPKWESCGMCDACQQAPEWLTSRSVRGRADAGSADVDDRRRAERGKKTPGSGGAGQPESCDRELLEYLREWRRERSLRDNLPAFMILHDSALEDLGRKFPKTPAELLHVSGIGEKKAAALGPDILAVLEAYRGGARASERQETKTSPAEETLRMLAEGLGFEDIARIRERRLQTVIDLVAELVERDRLEFNDQWIPTARREQIEAVIERIGVARMKSIKDELPSEISYGEIRLVVARSRRAHPKKGPQPADAKE